MFGCEEKLNVLEKAWSILFQNFFFFVCWKNFPGKLFLEKKKINFGCEQAKLTFKVRYLSL